MGVRTVKFSDLSNKEADDISEVELSINGTVWTLDLTESELADLHKAVSKFTAVATETSPKKAPRTASTKPPKGRTDVKEAREWLTANGYDPPARGRLNPDLWAAFDAR